MTKTQIKSLIKKAIASLDKAQQCMDVLRNAVDETYEDKYQQENIVAAIHIIAEKIKKLYPEKSIDKIKKTFTWKK